MKPRRTNQILVLSDGRQLPIWQMPISTELLGGVGVPCVSTTALEFPPRPAPAPRSAAICPPVAPHVTEPLRPSRRAAYVAAIARAAECTRASVESWLARCEVRPTVLRAIEAAAARQKWGAA
jgi:hypothetical protein